VTNESKHITTYIKEKEKEATEEREGGNGEKGREIIHPHN